MAGIPKRQNALRAVNRDLRGPLAAVADTAMAEVARQLAREFDAGDRPAATQLTRVLVELGRQAAAVAKAKTTGDAPGAVEEVDRLDDLAARRRARLAEAAGEQRAAVGDERGPGGRRAR